MDKVALDRASIQGIRLSSVNCHPSNAQRFIAVYQQSLQVNSGALLEIRPQHSHPLYVQLIAYVYRHPVILHYIHLLLVTSYVETAFYNKLVKER